MNTEADLIESVQELLRTKFNIYITLPPLKNLIDTKINLKMNASSIPQDINRYHFVIQQVEQLLNQNNLTLVDLKEFMDLFLQIINADIQMMERNQSIRMGTFKIKEKLMYRTEDVKKKKSQLIEITNGLHDKEDVLTFIAVDLKNYLASIKIITEEYEAVKKIEVNTPIRIDNIYQFELGSQEDYLDHYQPLLQVLVRLRSNMKNLYTEAESCSRADLPLKSVNLLANCKNLLNSLEEFIMTDKCSFNRLIFHVVSQQDENMKLVSTFYRYELQFIKNLIYNVYKSVFLGYIFSPRYNDILNQVSKQQEAIFSTILNFDKDLGRPEGARICEKRLEEHGRSLAQIRSRIRTIKKIICFKQTFYLKRYLQEKICKKLNLFLNVKQKLIRLEILLEDSKKYIINIMDVINEVKELPKNQDDIQNAIQQIEKDPTLADRMNLNGEEQPIEKRKENIFRNKFQVIQNKYIKLNSLSIKFENDLKECVHEQLRRSFFSDKMKEVRMLKGQYLDLQVRLLNGYQHLLNDKEEKEAEALALSDKNLNEIQKYLTNEKAGEDGSIWSSMGFEIMNQDSQCDQIKDKLAQIDKSEYLLKNYLRQNPQKSDKKELSEGQKKIKQLQFNRKCLEWLLVIFEGSMDEKIFESILDRMDYTEDSPSQITRNINKVNQLLAQLKKYNTQLKKISKQIQFRNGKEKQEKKQGKIFEKVYRISKERLILYELVQTFYSDCLTSYSSLKTNASFKNYHSIQKKGLKLFDKGQNIYVLALYEAVNKINILQRQIKDVKMLTKTENYILDDLFDPYNNRLNQFIENISQENLLNIILRLEEATKVQNGWKVTLKKFEDDILDTGELTEKEYKNKIKIRSKEVLKLEEQCANIDKLAKKDYVVHNVSEITAIFEQIDQHCELADGIINSQSLDDVCKGRKFGKPRMNELHEHILQVFKS